MSDLAATPAAPVITSVQCQTAGANPAFQLTWQPQQGYDGPFSVVVTASAGTAITGTVSQAGPNGATWTATQSMDAASDSYYVQVEAAGFPGVISDKVPLLFAPVSAITTSFDGVSLLVSWAAPASMTPTGSTQILLLNPAGGQAAVSTDNGFGQIIVGANLRGASGDWSVYLTPQFGISSGPQSAAAPVYHAVPAVQAVSVLGAAAGPGGWSNVNLQLTITVEGASVPETPFIAMLHANGARVQTSAAFTGTWQHDANRSICTAAVQFAYPMNVASSFGVAVAQSSSPAGVTTGPAGAESAPVLLAPQGLTATVTANGDDRVVDVVIAPLAGASGQPSGSLVSITGPDGFKAPGQPGDGFQRSLTLTAPTIGGAYLLYGAQASGANLGPWTGDNAYPGDGSPGSSGLPLVTSIPALSTISVGDSGAAALSWAAVPDAGVTGYRVQALTGGAVAASALFTGTSGSLAVSGTALAFSVAAVAGPVTGPTSAAAPAIVSAPAGLAAAWTSTGEACVLTWTAPAGGAAPDGYALTVYNGETPVHQANAPGATYTVPAGVLNAASGFTFRVAATAGGPPALTGPQSAPAAIISAAPGALTAAYDGATVRASWRPVPGATGYRVVLLLDGAESGSPWFTSEPAASAPLAYDAAKAYSLAVQATGQGATGPAATVSVFAAGLYPQFGADTAAALIPAAAPSMAAHPVAIGLPQIFTTPPADPLPSTPPFTLSAGTSPYAYILTIAGDSGALPWVFTADPVRADLYTAYTDFLGQLAGAGATPAGIQTVQDAIARAMPQTFAETLLYAYGFTGPTGYADLLPGMVLRVEYESYLTMGAGAPNQAELNGFITSAVAHYPIVRSAGGATIFTSLDAFLARLAASGGTSVSQPPVSNRKQAGGGGLIDGFYPQMQQPFLRLVYPQSFPSTAETGTPYPEFNAVLLAASTLTDLEAATTHVRQGSPAGGNVGVLYFRGRTTMVPLLRVLVDGAEQWAPLGATVGDILAARAMAPSAVGLPLTGLRMLRGTGAALAGSPAVYDAGGGAPVHLDWAPGASAALLALPLLGGDRIQLGGDPA